MAEFELLDGTEPVEQEQKPTFQLEAAEKTPDPEGKTALNLAVHDAENTMPELVLEEEALAERFGVTKHAAAAARDELKRRAAMRDALEATEGAPATRRHFSDANNMAVGKNDLPQFADYEKAAKNTAYELTGYGADPVDKKPDINEYGFWDAFEQQRERFGHNLEASLSDMIGLFTKATGISADVLADRGGLMARHAAAKQLADMATEWLFKHSDEEREAINKASLMLPPELRGSVIDNPWLLTSAPWWMYQTGEIAPSMIAMVMIGGATGGTAAGAAVGSAVAGGMEAASTYRELTEKHGMEERRAMEHSLTFGLAVAALNKIGLDRIFGKAGTRSIAGRILQVLGTAGIEGVTEWAEEPTEAFIKGAALNKDGEEIVADALLAAREGVNVFFPSMVMGGGMQTMSNTAQWAADRKANKLQETEQKLFEVLDNIAQGTETVQSAPTHFQRTIKAIQEEVGGEVRNVLVDARAFKENLAENAIQVAADVGVDEQSLNEIAASGGFIEIPVERYSTSIASVPEYNAALMRHRKFAHESFTIHETEEASASLYDELESMTAVSEGRRATDDQVTKEANEIVSKFRAMVKEAGSARGSDVGAAQLYAARLATIARRSEGQYTVAQLHNDYGIGGFFLDDPIGARSVSHSELLDNFDGRNAPSYQKAVADWYEQGTDSDIFSQWFDGSEVVDDEGDPLLLRYDDAAQWDENSEGLYLSPATEESLLSPSGDVDEVYVNLQNPLVVTTDEGVVADLPSLMSEGHDGVILKNSKGEVKGVYAPKRDSVKVLQPRGTQRGRTFYQTYKSLDDNQKVAVDQVLREQPDRRLSNAMRRVEGTPWEKNVTEGMLIRRALQEYMEGRDPSFDNKFSRSNVPAHATLREAMKAQGEEAAWQYLVASDFIGTPAKSKRAVSSSYTTCNPTKACASYCYAANGRNYASNLVKQELIQWAVERDPARVAEHIAREYMTTNDFEFGKALRLFDRGDISPEWLPVIDGLNARGIRAQVFSRKPELLEQVGEENVRLLSIDKNNRGLVNKYPQFGIAVLYTGQSDLKFIDSLKDRFKDRGGVILPLRTRGVPLANELVMQLPAWTAEHVCPIDSGQYAVAGSQEAKDGKPEWNCTKCQARGGLGCFLGQNAQTLSRTETPEETFDEWLARADEFIGREDTEERREILAKLVELNERYGAIPHGRTEGETDASDGRDSANENRSGGEPRVLYQSRRAELGRTIDGLYSGLEDAVLKLDFKAAPPRDLANRIKKQKGVKKEEMEDLGFMEWLEGQDGKVTKEDVLDFIRAGGVKIVEVNRDYVAPDSVDIASPSALRWDGEGEGSVDAKTYSERLVLVDTLDNERHGRRFKIMPEQVDTQMWFRFESTATSGHLQGVDSELFRTYDEAFAYIDEYLADLEEGGMVAERGQPVEDEINLMHGTARASVAGENYVFRFNPNLMDSEPTTVMAVMEVYQEMEGEALPQFVDSETVYMDDTAQEMAEAFLGRVYEDRASYGLSATQNRINETLELYAQYASTEIGATNHRAVLLRAPHGGATENTSKLYGVRFRLPNWQDVESTLSRRDEIELVPKRFLEQVKAALIKSGVDEGTIKFDEDDLASQTRAYLTNHWDGANIMTHARLQDAHPSFGKTLLIDEIQSDWHQQGRKDGYVGGSTSPQFDAYLESVLEDIASRIDYKEKMKAASAVNVEELQEKNKAGEEYVDISRLLEETGKAFALAMERRGEARKARRKHTQNLRAATYDGVPNAVFKKSWHMLTFKKLLHNAIEEGYENVALSSGMTQAIRYKMMDKLGRMEWGSFDGETVKDLVMYDTDYQIVQKYSGNIEGLLPILGKANEDVIRRILSDESRVRDEPPFEVSNTGMSSFYENILRKDIQKYLKTIDPSIKLEMKDIAAPFMQGQEVLRRDVERFAYVFPVTDKLREHIKTEGQTLYQTEEKAPRGAIHLDDTIFSGGTERPLIELFRRRDDSTIPHELGHYFLELTRFLALQVDAHPEMMRDWHIAKKALGLENDGVIGKEAHEKFAEEFEKYLSTGKAPSINLRNLFERFKVWMLSVYRALMAGGDFEPNETLAALFDRMLATDEEIAEVRNLYSAGTAMFDPNEIPRVRTRENYKKLKEAADEEEKAVQFKRLWNAYKRKMKLKPRIEDAAVIDVNNDPVYMAYDEIRGKHGKIDPAHLEYLFGKDLVHKFRTKYPNLLSKNGKITLETTAYEYGFADPWSLIDALMKAPSKSEAIKQRVEQALANEEAKMRAEFMDGVTVSADGAYHNDARLAVLVAEAQIIQEQIEAEKRVQQFEVPANVDKDAKAKAKKAVERLTKSNKNKTERELKAYIEDIIEADPVYEAIKRFKKSPLSRDSVIADYGTEGVAQLNAAHAGLVRSWGTGALDDQATELGFEDGDSLYHAILSADKVQDYKAQLYNEMYEELVQETLPENEAKDIYDKAYDRFIANDPRTKVAYGKFLDRALEREDKPTKAESTAIRMTAREQLQGAKLKDVNPRKYLSVERQCARKSRSAKRKGDLEEALKWKRLELLNHSMALEALTMRKEINETIEKLKKLGQEKNIADDWKQQLSSVLSRFGLSGYKMPLDIDGLILFMEKQANPDADNPFVPAIPELPDWWDDVGMASGDGKGILSLMNREQLWEYEQIVSWLAGTGKDMLTGRLVSYDATVEEVATKCAEPMAALKKRDKPEEKYGIFRTISVGTAGFIADHTQLPFIFDFADAYTNAGKDGYHGVNRREMGNRLADASSNELQMLGDMNTRLESLFEVFNEFGKKHGRFMETSIPVPAIMKADGRRWTYDRMLAVVMNMGTEKNKKRLMDGYGFTEEDLNAIAAQFTARELKGVQALWDFTSEYWDSIVRETKRTAHFIPKKEEAVPLTVVSKDGQTVELRGGYHPIAYDHSLSIKVAEWGEKDDLMQRQLGGKPSVRSGMVKGRAQTVMLPLDLSMNVLHNHLEDTIHLITHMSIIKDVDAITQHPVWREMFVEKHGEALYRVIRPMLRNIGRPNRQAYSSLAVMKLDEWFEKTRKLSTAAILGLNFSVAAKQIFSLGGGMVDVGFSSFWKGAWHAITHYSEAKAAMHELSPYMRARSKTVDYDIRRSVSKMTVHGMKTARRQQLRDFSFCFIRAVDFMAVYPLWNAAYKQACERNAAPADAIRYADETVRQSQPSATPYDLALMQSSRSGLTRLFNMFMTFTIKYGNRQRIHFRGWRAGQLSNKEYMTHFMVEGVITPMLMNAFFQYLWMGDDDEFDYTSMFIAPVVYQFVGLVFARDLAAMGISHIHNEMFGGDTYVPTLGAPPSLMAGTQTFDLVGHVTKWLADMGDEKKAERAFWTMANFASYWTGVPVARVAQKLEEGLRQYQEEDEDWPVIFIPDPSKRKKH